MTAMPVPAYILAGGRSSRFGSDKALALLDGEPLILRLARALREMARPVIAVADRPGKYAVLGVPTLADCVRGLGPLGGLLTALRHARHRWILLASCDLVEIRPRWISLLLAGRHPGTLAVAFRGAHWQPMPALYHKLLCAAAERQIRRRELALWKLIEQCRHVALPLPQDWPAVAQVNTPADLRRVRRAMP